MDGITAVPAHGNMTGHFFPFPVDIGKRRQFTGDFLAENLLDEFRGFQARFALEAEIFQSNFAGGVDGNGDGFHTF